jgi:hypothetical protein
VAKKPKPAAREWTVEQKARVLAEASKLDGVELTAYLEREGVKLATARSSTSRLTNGIAVATALYSRAVTSCTNALGARTRSDGAARRAIGRPSRSSSSIPSERRFRPQHD